MIVSFCMLVLIAIFGGEVSKFRIAGIQLIYIAMSVIVLINVITLIKSGKVKFGESEKSLLRFVTFGVLVGIVSFAGINRFLLPDGLFYDSIYVPRQMFYLFILPNTIISVDALDGILKRIKGKEFFLFLFIYISHIIYLRSFTISIVDVFLLGWIILIQLDDKADLNKKVLIQLLLLVFTPYELSGEMTNVIIRLLFIGVFLYKNKVHMNKLLRVGVNMCVSLSLVVPILVPHLSFLDANTDWRLRYWNDEIINCIRTCLLGVGFGTTYASLNFVGDFSVLNEGGPFAATADYSILDKMFVTGPHNSYVSIFFRMGIIGIILFMVFINKVLKKSYLLCNIKKSTIFVIYASLIVIGLNVGLESPYYVFLFATAFGILIDELKKEGKN